MPTFSVYITTNRSGGLYIGVTNGLDRRIGEHKGGDVFGFTSRYNLNRVVYVEEFSSIREAKDLVCWRDGRHANGRDASTS